MHAKSTRVLLLIWFTGLALVAGYFACSDDTIKTDTHTVKKDGHVDGPTDGPADVAIDGPVFLDSMSTDGPIPGTNTCSAVLSCFTACGKACAGDTTCILGCHSTCSAKGCTSAQTAWGNFFNCVVNSCATDCVADPTSSACETCYKASCSTEYAACTADAC